MNQPQNPINPNLTVGKIKFNEVQALEKDLVIADLEAENIRLKLALAKPQVADTPPDRTEELVQHLVEKEAARKENIVRKLLDRNAAEMAIDAEEKRLFALSQDLEHPQPRPSRLDITRPNPSLDDATEYVEQGNEQLNHPSSSTLTALPHAILSARRLFGTISIAAASKLTELNKLESLGEMPGNDYYLDTETVDWQQAPCKEMINGRPRKLPLGAYHDPDYRSNINAMTIDHIATISDDKERK